MYTYSIMILNLIMDSTGYQPGLAWAPRRRAAPLLASAVKIIIVMWDKQKS